MDKYILITGGELFNKGAESMTFVAVDEIKERFPGRKIILLSSRDYDREKKEKENYKFDILPINTSIVLEILGGPLRILWEAKAKKVDKKYSSVLPKIKKVLLNTEAIIDVSGYALSSQFGTGSSLGYLLRIKLAKKYGIDVYLMPQSFGPFSYKGLGKPIIKFLMKDAIKYPKVIYARENEGYNFLAIDYKLKNVKKSYDLVLMNKGINLSNVFKEMPEIPDFQNIGGVAIVPNMKNLKHGNVKQIISLYSSVIKSLLKSGKKVYLIRHSFEDIKACEMIKEKFYENENVIMITDDMSSFEFDELVKKFDFIIGSRFHSIVHAYKNSIPCIALGWATKYHELLEIFNQENYIFDVRNNLDTKKVESAVETMLYQYQKESKNISEQLSKVQNHNVFDVLNQ
ncbi:polysaccharide pyruvyl transferase family protein [Alkalihalobacillus trypoxylicola]|uniref:Polysaccharide pyruvyl transferase domain-containing protein n=1 Tax=Alkalihalobacillus trypoxylicola TaxID=519424 RepID=A0A162DQS8_9BACI|nr:polysaccharide pyruvyl transferase family protein [Alkalihalobacillus trypoxylicola]KYG30592.1 hypothetical protein AZF04_19285 [Alkalihalobacillus trypoxylicola]